MKKVIAVLALLSAAALGACHSSTRTVVMGTPVAGDGRTGGSDPTTALRGFLDAAKRQDLQGLSNFWGDKDGLARDRFSRPEAEMREMIFVKCLATDHYDIVGDAPGQGGSRVIAVNLVGHGKSAVTNFTMMPTAEHRWYVYEFDLPLLTKNYCKS